MSSEGNLMAPRRRIACRLIGTLVCLLIPSTAEPAPPEGKPVLVPIWKKTTIGIPSEDDFNADVNKPVKEWLAKQYAKAVEDCRKRSLPMIPPGVPIVLNGYVVYVNDQSLAELALKGDKSVDPPIRPGDIVWASEFDFWTNFRKVGPRTELDNWLAKRGTGQTELILNRTLSRAFSGRETVIQFVESLPLLPPVDKAKAIEAEYKRGPLFSPPRADWDDYLLGDELRVLDQTSGKLRIKLPRTDLQPVADKKPFGNSVYFGALQQTSDRSVVIHETGKKIRLTCVSWDRIRKSWELDPRSGLLQAANNGFLWDTELLAVANSALIEPHRRIHAIHLALANDLVICPTHLGRVIAVDSKTGKIKWTHEYAPLDAKRFAPEWVVVPPVVIGDKYIYAPADFPELLCINVADGKKVWSVKKGDGLYPAVVGEQVLVIGEKALRSLSLKDGSEQWKIDLPGLPCGRGAVLGDTYLLPISEPKTWRGMIAIVDLKTQKIREVLKPDKDEPIGNLVVHQDMLISQTLTEIAVFPIRK
jgi:PQQ-like domain